MLLSLFITIFLHIQAVFAADKETLIFSISSVPPNYFEDGPFKGKGRDQLIIDGIRTELQKKYIIDERKMPFSRVMTFFKDRRNFCFGPLQKNNEREKYILFSNVITVVLPPILIYRKGTFKGNSSDLSLRELIDENKILIGLEQTSSYGSLLDPIIQYGLKKRPRPFFMRPGYGSREALFLMLKSNRIQATIGILDEFFYYKKIHQNKKFEVDYKLIKENMAQDIGLGYFGCSKNEIGQKAIELMNALLQNSDFNFKKKTIEGYKNWVDTSSLERLEKYLDEI